MSKGKNIFYHYTTLDGLCGIIDEEHIYATHINYLNDPLEEKYSTTLIDEFLNKNEYAKSIHSILYDKYYESIFQNSDKYIISFSESSDSLSMWNYYAKGNGYNIGINIDNIINNLYQKKSIICRRINIVYDQSLQNEIISKFFESERDNALNFEIKSAQMNDLEKLNLIADQNYDKLKRETIVIRVLYMEGFAVLKRQFKHSAYSNEKEIRLITSIDNYKKNDFLEIYYRKTTTGIIIPFVKIPLNRSNDIVSITLHPLHYKPGQECLALDGLQHYLKSKEIDSNINIIQSKIPYREI